MQQHLPVLLIITPLVAAPLCLLLRQRVAALALALAACWSTLRALPTGRAGYFTNLTYQLLDAEPERMAAFAAQGALTVSAPAAT